ncbi:response regulator transcription factor [Pseudovibrio sp. Tun.PSC04-5.I4]|uniref:response regulator transcription factor n=1 Tax=Pseudovibrio sp. Tun.PSC04-5.I4 TaxID=1798213 RepID=UPI00088809EF|nr:response regulator transcription factor [Pseudovibrio sp. Tun.PSC04-5.I4]SDQ72615.1 DNA-binding response regulator, NarL/FixJ family, contains REC and HTH domains [Pseudovibrio sp. Tun.PSC04-5.I4]
MYRERQTTVGTLGEKVSMHTVIIGDPHPAFSRALASIYSNECHGVNVLVTKSYSELQTWVELHPSAIVLVNPRMKGAPGLGTASALLETYEISSLVMLLEQDNPGLSEYFITRGASAAIPKTTDFSVFKAILTGGSAVVSAEPEEAQTAFSVDFYEGLANLTRRQATILTYLKEGKLNKQIAHELGISEATVKHHVSALLSTLGFYSRSQLVAMINDLGINVDYRGGNRKANRGKASARRVAGYKIAGPGAATTPATSLQPTFITVP